MRPAGGQPAAVAYLRGSDGTHRAFGVAVLTMTTTGIGRIVVFGGTDLVARFGFPPVPAVAASRAQGQPRGPVISGT